MSKTKPTPEPDLIPRLEAADVAGVCVRTIDRRIKAGILTRYAPAGTNKVFVDRGQLDEVFTLRAVLVRT